MAMRIRKSVWSLTPDDMTLHWYARAVEALRQRPATDQTSWVYLAAIHNVRQGVAMPPGAGRHWRQCQHQSWFFLPWHRGYLACFEAIVGATVEELGGPADWALPYWDYSEPLSRQPMARHIPPPFRNRTLPGGATNFLWAPRAQAPDGDFGFTDEAVSLDALDVATFTSAGLQPGFGGPNTGFNLGGGDNGAVEDLPHNWIHGFLGGETGFMSFTTTAALDPIFWLHHCNLDRLWEVWRNKGDGRSSPTQAAWLTAQRFSIPRSATDSFSFTSADMLDTTQILHGYRYDSVPPAVEPAAEPVLEAVAMARQPDLVGASDGLALEGTVTRTDVPIRRELSERFTLESVAPVRVHLQLDAITGLGAPGNFRVLVGPQGSEPSHVAGQFSTFGLESASDPAAGHGKLGLTKTFDITHLAGPLGLHRADRTRLEIAFERLPLRPTETEPVPDGLESLAPPPAPASIRIGRINLFFE
jgi:tyrosinase